MPRNSSGTYTLPEAAFVPGTVISSTAVNSDFSDVGDALTDSLSRNGEGAMLAELQMDPDGFVYSNDPNTGMHRTAADEQAIKCGGTDIVTIGMSGIDVAGAITQNGFNALLVGEIRAYAGATAPSGWLLSYGQAISRTTYAALFAIIGTTYGSGDGSTTFNVPDLRGRAIAGKDDMGGSAASRLTSTTMSPDGNTLGATGGAQTVTVAQANLPNVNFNVTIPSGQGSHKHRIGFALNATAPGSAEVPQNYPSTGAYDTETVTLPAMSGTAASGGSGTALSNVQPTIITNYIIFAGV